MICDDLYKIQLHAFSWGGDGGLCVHEHVCLSCALYFCPALYYQQLPSFGDVICCLSVGDRILVHFTFLM